MISKKLTGLLAAGAIAVAAATLLAGASNARVIIKPGLWNAYCAFGFSKTQSNHNYTCYRNFARICRNGKIKGMPVVVQTGANIFQVRYTCTNKPS